MRTILMFVLFSNLNFHEFNGNAKQSKAIFDDSINKYCGKNNIFSRIGLVAVIRVSLFFVVVRNNYINIYMYMRNKTKADLTIFIRNKQHWEMYQNSLYAFSLLTVKYFRMLFSWDESNCKWEFKIIIVGISDENCWMCETVYKSQIEHW